MSICASDRWNITLRHIVDFFAIVPSDGLWGAVFFTQSFSMLWCCIGACAGAIGVWLLAPHRCDISHTSLYKDIDTAPHIRRPNIISRALWSIVAACLCGIAGGSMSIGIAIWLCVLAILILSLCVWDFSYCAVPNWQNLALLILGISKSALPLIAPPPYNLGLDIAVLYNLLLGAGLLGLIYVLSMMIFHKPFLGEGDIVFCASFSAIFGFEALIISIFWGCMLATCVIIISTIIARRTPRIVPLIPCIVGGLGMGALWGMWI